MKRAIPIFVVLVTVLSVLLYLRLRKQRLEADRPTGGSATVEGIQTDIVSRLPSRITAIHVREGDPVKAGQVLVELDCAEHQALLAQVEAALQGAQVEAEAAEANESLSRAGVKSAKSQVWMAHAAAQAAAAQTKALEVQRGVADRSAQRLEKVHEAGALSEQAFDQSRSQVAGLDRQIQALGANLKAARAQTLSAASGEEAARLKTQLALLGKKGALVKIQAAEAAVARTRVAVGECTLKAPTGGIVLTRNNEPGEVVLPGSRILTLVNIREVKAIFYLPNAELAAAKPGRAVQVRADAHPRKVFKGVIRRVGVEAEFTPRNVQTREDRDRLVYAVEVTVPNPEGLLRPGMPVEISIPGTGKGR